MIGYRKTVRFLGATVLGLSLVAPAWAQLPFPVGGRGGGFGLEDVISILGSRGTRGVVVENRRSSKAQAAIQLATVLYEASKKRSSLDPESGNFPTPETQAPSPSNGGGSARPQDYEYIVNNGLPARLDGSILPLSINPGNEPYQGMTSHAIDTWNAAGAGQLFELTHGQADLTIDWSGAKVSPGARAETRMRKSARGVIPTDLSVKTANRNSEQLARVVTHELGHVLGLDHSHHREDVMYDSEQNRAPALSKRDKQMLGWLYSQSEYSPIVGATDVEAAAHRLPWNPFLEDSVRSDVREQSEPVCGGH